MRTTPPASRCRFPRVDRLLTVVVAAAMSAAVACHDDAMSTNPIAPSSPGLAVSGDGTWLVNSLADPGDGVCANNECTLREAIAAAQSGDHITFKSNLSGPIALSAGELAISKGLFIDGPGADRIAVSGVQAHRVFHIGLGPGVTISNLMIRDGAEPDDAGGGIRVEAGGTLTLIGSVVRSNTAERGAGIFALGVLRVVGSTVADNVATGVGGGISAENALTVRRSTISDNRSLQGGGIFVICDGECPATITSSTITTNIATTTGGGFFNHASGGAWVFNTIIAGNRANGDPTDPAADCDSQVQPLGYSLSGDGTGCGIAGPTDVVVSPLQVFTSVLEGVLAANGSSRLTHALIERGYAVDAGYCPGESGDQRGFPRPYDDPRMPNALDACDIGAFEWLPADSKIKGSKP